MLCAICKKNQANVHITKIINGEKQEFDICDECAKRTEGMEFGGNMIFDTQFSFQNILSGLMDYLNQTPQAERVEPVCKNCGTTFSEFKKNGFLGCSECYNYFDAALIPVIRRVQGNVEHVGKIPHKSGKGILEKRELEKLKDELQKAIQSEEYEKAAEIRDKIRAIKGKDK